MQEFIERPKRCKIGGSRWLCGLIVAACLAAASGCNDAARADGAPSLGTLQLVWGERGVAPGHLQKPRAMTIDAADQLYIVDMTARIQVYDANGTYLRGWQTPTHEQGRPTGISIGRDGSVLVPDTHYYRVLVYSPTGELLRQIGGVHGNGPGEFGFVTDVAEDAEGNYFVSEYGEFDRIQKFTHQGKFIRQWGAHGDASGDFARPQSMAIDDAAGRLYVADACNHRVQIFDLDGKFISAWGEAGSEPGKLYYPYGLALDGRGHVLICEYGNHRVQEFTLDGRTLGCWGSEGREPGQLFNPWTLVLDSSNRLHVLDSNNHRVQRVALKSL